MPTAPSEIKFQVQNGKRIYKYPVKTWVDAEKLCFAFDYNPDLIKEVKAMRGARWKPEDKCWWIPVDEKRNTFQLMHLMGKDPYAPWDCPVDKSIFPSTRLHKSLGREVPLLSHQAEMAAEMYWRPAKIIAGEMGTSKTLSNIIAGEKKCIEYREKHGDNPRWIYVAPRGVIAAVQREFRIWGSLFTPEWLTYEGLVKLINHWPAGAKAPLIVTFDEASKVKNENAQRSLAAKSLADGIRSDWGFEGRIILMSGSPAPKSPADWYSLAEIAQPGFLKEGDINKFKRRLAIIIQKDSPDGGVYPQLLAWRDDEKKCDICGQFKDAPIHDEMFSQPQEPTGPMRSDRFHHWKACVNEVKELYSRLTGLVSVYFKKDVLDLPEKFYRTIECKPSKSILRAANLITRSASTTIQGLTLLRELSDGFQYKEVDDGYRTCPLCKGANEIDHLEEIPDSCPNCKNLTSEEDRVREGPHDYKQVCGNHQPETIKGRIKCPTCGGIGQVKKYRTEIEEVECPKDQALSDLLDEYDDVGRLVVFAGFTGSIDRCVRIVQQAGWSVIRMDQGAIKIADCKGGLIPEKDFISMFQDRRVEHPKVAFVAHPKSGGMGLTLTASPASVYFSNTFDAEDRIQSEDRIHRMGMDTNRGATIIDLVHLPSDQKILDNLKKKRDLQALTLGDFANILDEGEVVTR